MAKSQSKETSVPVICALVFFVLTTIGLGVFCYVQYSDAEAKDKEVENAKAEVKKMRDARVEAELVAKVDRVFFGVPMENDWTSLATDMKEGDAGFNELKRLVQLTKDKASKGGKDMTKVLEDTLTTIVTETVAARQRDPKAAVRLALSNINFAEGLDFWEPKMDGRTGQVSAPTGNMLDVTIKSKVLRDLALKQAADDRDGYTKNAEAMAQATQEQQAARKNYTAQAAALPAKFNADKAAIETSYDKRVKQFDAESTKQRADLSATKDELEKSNVVIKRLKEDDIPRLNGEIIALLGRIKPADPLKFDEPQGRIVRRLSDNLVEIDLGSNVRVREGLTFSVLPNDYPEKGEASRLRELRVPNGRGGFKSELTFVPKAKIEVIEVMGPNLSKAKITDEFDDIRDKAMPGDLLYNTAWRKGAPEHVALVGIFDINGDGSDDLEQVVRDLRKMGVLVDAYYDPNKKNQDGSFGGFQGTITDQTRYIVKGYFPDPTATDPNLAKMSELNTKYTKALEQSKRSGATVVGMKDFFPRMGYKIRLDVTDDRIRQAARKYLDPVGSAAPLTNTTPQN